MKRLPAVVLTVALTGSFIAAGERSLSRMNDPQPDADRPDASWEEVSPPSAFVGRLSAKREVVRAVIDGRLSLFEGASLVGAIHRSLPEMAELSLSDAWTSPLGVAPRTDEERLCRQILWGVATQLEDDPARARAVTERLVAEYWGALSSLGTIRLPEPSAVGIDRDWH
jgi:hypothetical protein